MRGVIPFPPVHATLLPDGRVMFFSTTNVHARAAWFTPGPIGEDPPPLVVLTPDHVPVDVDPPLDFKDASGLEWHVEETLFCSGHSLTADGSLFSAGVSHELRTPLARMLALVDTLELDLDAAERDPILEGMRGEIDGMRRLIEEMVMLAILVVRPGGLLGKEA